MTVLDDIIDASTDPSVAVSNLLRKVQIAAHRLGAHDVVTWVKRELSGYGDGDPVPSYRVLHTDVEGTFLGPRNSFRRIMLSVKARGMEDWWDMQLRQPVAQLQTLANIKGELDPTREWPTRIVSEYEKSGVFRLGYYRLYTARNIVSRHGLRGLLDGINSKALEFALELQSANPDAGSAGGPTVESEPVLAGVIQSLTHNIYEDGVSLAAIDNIAPWSRFRPADAVGLEVRDDRAGSRARVS